MASTFSGISCLIWGLVLQKARNGMDVSSSKDSSTVSDVVKKTGTIICLIIGATALQFFANYNTLESAIPASHPALQSSHFSLKAASPIVEDLPESYYDSSSSHYMGGAHNVALQAAAKTMKTSDVQVPTQASMGGAHNSALNALAL